MNFSNILSRVKGRCRRALSELFFTRRIKMRNNVPYISFTFDDFPRSSLHAGGEILGRYGLRGTYYASFGLMGTEAPTGSIFLPEDIKELLSKGHELGCHTFAHSHSWETSSNIFDDSINKNRQALDSLVPGSVFKTFSYPILGPCPNNKRIAGKYFSCCRGGGQTHNVNVVDLNLLKAFFLEKNRNDPDRIKAVIDQNYRDKGWLIFATHDIDEHPTPYGCTPSFFAEIVKYAVDSGARILPVAEAQDCIFDN